MKQNLLSFISIRSGFRLGAAAALVLLATQAASAQTSTSPKLYERFTIPMTVEEGGAEIMNLTPDGRVIVVDSTGVISLETELASGQFQTLGELPEGDFSSFGPSFVAVSPDARLVAVGNNGGADFSNPQVGVFELDDIQTGRWLDGSHFSGTWWDNQKLLITTGAFGQPAEVVVLNTDSPLAQAPERTQVVQGIGGASGAVMLDAQENLWTANGFRSSGPSQTGAVHRIDRQGWQAAFNEARPAVNFETEATPVARALGASSMALDLGGNLWIGGSVTFGAEPETGFAAFFSADKVKAVLAGERAPLDSRVEEDLIKVDTDRRIEGQSYAVFAAPNRQGVLLRESSTLNVYAYELTPAVSQGTVPAPALGGFGGLAFLGLGLGASLFARQRRA